MIVYDVLHVHTSVHVLTLRDSAICYYGTKIMWQNWHSGLVALAAVVCSCYKQPHSWCHKTAVSYCHSSPENLTNIPNFRHTLSSSFVRRDQTCLLNLPHMSQQSVLSFVRNFAGRRHNKKDGKSCVVSIS